MAKSSKMAGVKCVVLSIKEKLEVVHMLKTSSHKVIAEKFGVGISTVSAIKNNEAKLLAFKSELADIGMSRQAEVMYLGDITQLDKAVCLLMV